MGLNRMELLDELRGGEAKEDLRYFTPGGYESDMGYEMLRRTEVLGITLEVREVDGQWQLFAPAGKLPSDLRARCKAFRDPIIRAVWMKAALDYLRGQGIPYVLPASEAEEDIQASYEDDTLDEFRDTVRGWIRELVKS